MEETLKKQDAELLQLVTFSIGEEEFGVDILSVQEIIRMMDITKVPRAPDFVEGVINLRGKVIPIIDLRRRFGLSTRDHDKHTRIIVIEINNMGPFATWKQANWSVRPVGMLFREGCGSLCAKRPDRYLRRQ